MLSGLQRKQIVKLYTVLSQNLQSLKTHWTKFLTLYKVSWIQIEVVSVQRLTSVVGLPPTIRNKFVVPCIYKFKFETNKYNNIILIVDCGLQRTSNHHLLWVGLMIITYKVITTCVCIKKITFLYFNFRFKGWWLWGEIFLQMSSSRNKSSSM